MRKLLPVIMILLGLGGGTTAGLLLKPAPAPVLENPCGTPEDSAAPVEPAAPAPDETLEYVKMNNQFIVPVVSEDAVQALVVLTLSLEVQQGKTEMVYAREPKLRDAFLQVLFDHANMGRFRGTFTESNNLDILRAGLLQAARAVLGERVSDILIVDIARQDG